MAEQTSLYRLTKPDYNEYVDVGVLNRNFDIIDEALGEIGGRRTYSFDNLLAWPGCKRITPKKSGSTWTERIVTKDGGLLRAQRVTVIASEGDITETYTFYAEDGATVAAKYIVHSTKDGAETWTEDVTKEETT